MTPHVPLDELVDLGVLHEVNRRLLHPVGLTLAVDDGRLVVEDHRDVEEGVVEEADPVAADTFGSFWLERAARRYNLLNFVVAPVERMQL